MTARGTIFSARSNYTLPILALSKFLFLAGLKSQLKFAKMFALENVFCMTETKEKDFVPDLVASNFSQIQMWLSANGIIAW